MIYLFGITKHIKYVMPMKYTLQNGLFKKISKSRSQPTVQGHELNNDLMLYIHLKKNEYHM